MPESQPKPLKAPTLIRSIRCTFSLRRHLGCSSSAAAAIRMSANWQPPTQPNTPAGNIENTKNKNVKSKQRKAAVATTPKSAYHRRGRQQQFVDVESPPVSPSPSSDSSPDSIFSSHKRFGNRLQLVARDALRSTQLPKRHGGGTSPVTDSLLDFESVFRIARSGTEDFATRYQHCAPPQRTPEEILMLQTNTTRGRSDAHDQFRAWRLDTDAMTYEQLLALGEKMGYVNTGLGDNEILRCIKKIKFLGRTSSPFSEDVEQKCSICQEEYKTKDKLGVLSCAHSYHSDCINQWLRHKKTCPVCKTEVIPLC